MPRCPAVLALLLLCLVGCGGSSAGHREPGAGGAGGTPLGTDPDGAFGGGPGVPAELSFVSWEIRSQVWSASLDDVPSMPRYLLELREEAGGCRDDQHRLGPWPHRLFVGLEQPAVGACPMDPDRTVGCTSHVVFVPGDGRGIPLERIGAAGATVRIDRFDGGVLRGEVRATFFVNPEDRLGASSDGRWLYCTTLSGAVRRCEVETPDQDCCNQGKPLEELVVPFDAAFCPDAVFHWEAEALAAVRAAAACPPVEVDCASACAAFAATCGTCGDCGDDELCRAIAGRYCERDAAACPDECAAATGQPLASIGMACLAAGASCDAWLPCLSSCGGDR